MARVVPELLLHWIWQKRLYIAGALRTQTGEEVEVWSPGAPASTGPDFVEAHLRIGGMQWIGDVEIDAQMRNWYEHRHHENPRYQRVILQVVWEVGGGEPPVDCTGRQIPVLSLSSAVPAARLKELRPTVPAFPCASLAKQVSPSHWQALYESWGEKRLQARHKQYRGEKALFQAFWEALAYSYGVPQGEPYRVLAQALPWQVLTRYAEGLLAKEAALLGMAGFLEKAASPKEPYEEALLEKWAYLQRKHGWASLNLAWKPTRPVASPAIRLAMLAALAEAYPQPTQLLEALPTTLPLPSLYWQRHWTWQRLLQIPLRRCPPLLLRNVRINALYPFAIYYLRASGRVERALEVLEAFRQMAPERHRYARLFATYAYPAQNAWQTQGQLLLWREACMPQRCLECPIGEELLGRRKKG